MSFSLQTHKRKQTCRPDADQSSREMSTIETWSEGQFCWEQPLKRLHQFGAAQADEAASEQLFSKS